MLHLHTHTHYTFGEALASPEEIAKWEKDHGSDIFAITDIQSVTSFIKAQSAAHDLGMTLIHGMEACITPPDQYSIDFIQAKIKALNHELGLKRTTAEMAVEIENEIKVLKATRSIKAYHELLYAMNPEGLDNLLKIYSSSDELIAESSILEHSNGLILVTGIHGGEFEYLVSIGELDGARDALIKWKSCFDGRIFMAVEPQYGNIRTGLDMQRNSFIETAISMAKELDIPLVAMNDCRYSDEGQRMDFRLFCNIFSTERLHFETDYHSMCEENDLRQRMATLGISETDINDAFEGVQKISSMCEKIEFPHAKPLKDCSAELRELCEKGFERIRKGTPREAEARKRLEYELEVINMKGFSEYFLKVLSIVKTAYNLGVICGPARGSGGGSEVCYLLGITKLDPLQYGLFFERFLNPGRPGYPDVDLDFASQSMYDKSQHDVEFTSDVSRNMIMQQLVNDGVFDFAGFIQNEVRATALVLFKNLAKYMGLPFYEANAITKAHADDLAKKSYDGWLKDAVESLGFDWEDNWDAVESKMGFCYRYAKIPYNNSIAASGVIMVDGNVQLPVREGVVRYNGKDLEKWGYIKFDILTVTTLDMIQRFDGLDYQWEPPKYVDTPLGAVPMNGKIKLANGETITGQELWDLINNGEEIDVQAIDETTI